MCSVYECMTHRQSDGHYQPSFPFDGFSCVHQRVIQRMAGGILCVGNGCEIQFGGRTEQDDIEIALCGNFLVGAVRVSIVRNGSDDASGFFVEGLEIAFPGNAYGVEGLSGDGNRSGDVYCVMVDHLSVFVPSVAEFLDFVGGTEDGIQVIQEKGMPLALASA